MRDKLEKLINDTLCQNTFFLAFSGRNEREIYVYGKHLRNFEDNRGSKLNYLITSNDQ